MLTKGAGVISLGAAGWGLLSYIATHLGGPILQYTGALIETAAINLRASAAYISIGLQVVPIIIAILLKLLSWCLYWIPEPRPQVLQEPAELALPVEQAIRSFTYRRKGKGMEAGTYVLLERGGEWDEVLLVKKTSPVEWLAYTTVPSGARTMWSLVELVLCKFRVINGWDDARVKPADVREGTSIGCATQRMWEPNGIWTRTSWTSWQPKQI